MKKQVQLLLETIEWVLIVQKDKNFPKRKIMYLVSIIGFIEFVIMGTILHLITGKTWMYSVIGFSIIPAIVSVFYIRKKHKTVETQLLILSYHQFIPLTFIHCININYLH
jgi:uncharacterized membrane protein YoaK (UPF0700 family)